MRVFEHGNMNKPDEALATFLEHAQTAGVLDSEGSGLRLRAKRGGFVVCEIGPGDSVSTAVIAKSLGASRTWLVDAGFFATTNMRAYTALIDYLRNQGIDIQSPTVPQRLSELLEWCGGNYLTNGVQSLEEIPTDSVDFCFSNAVLEHVPKDDLPVLATESFRVLNPGGIAVHRVDLKDHLGGALNNLRFPEVTWESQLFRRSGFYTNRTRFRKLVALFEKAGFECRAPRIVRWDFLPTPRGKMAQDFARLADEDLLVSGCDLVLVKRGNS